ncbi:MAG TPA: aspartyl beta-hydroxylase, partial [Phenylobacterium sp.]|nr:aspartyl beta-hydroxylase [Phenylobacterium sp.]
MTSAEVRQPDLSADVLAALQRGDRRGALALVLAAERAAPQDIGLKLQRAMVSRALGDLAGALIALDDALALDPYDYVALLSKGAVVERLKGERAAAAVYKNALSIAPPDDEIPTPLRAPTDRARQVVARTMEALEAHLKTRTGTVQAEVSDAARRRFDESVGIFAGRTRVYNQEPLLLHYP